MKKILFTLLLVSCLCAACGSGQTQTTEYSATEAAETSADSLYKKIIPLPSTVNLDQLQDCTLDVSLGKDALLAEESGNVHIYVTVHTYDLYDLVDISGMKAGDTIHINRKDLLITSLEESQYGSILINGGLEKGGHELRTDGSGVYYETGFSDAKSYYEIGSVTLPLSSDFVYVDASDLDLGETRYSLEEFISLYEETAFYFQPGSTSAVVENGEIIALTRIYVP